MVSVQVRLSLTRPALALLACGVFLASCSSASSGAASTPVPTLSSTATALPSTPTPVASDACSQTASGSQVTVAAPSILLAITYPTSLTETHCVLSGFSDGSWLFRVGNFVDVYAVPAAGRTVQQYVDAKKMSYETVTLSAITARQALEAYLVQVQLASNAPGPGYFNNRGVVALLRGSRYIYEVWQQQVAHYPVTTDTPAPQPLSAYVPGFAVS
jgi:hypothetical protein